MRWKSYMVICEFPSWFSVLSSIYRMFGKNRTIDKVDATMAAVNEQRELANEIAETIATPLYTDGIDDVCSQTYSSIITDFFVLRMNWNGN